MKETWKEIQIKYKELKDVDFEDNDFYESIVDFYKRTNFLTQKQIIALRYPPTFSKVNGYRSSDDMQMSSDWQSAFGY